MTSRNGKLNEVLSSVFETYVETNKPGYMIGTAMYCHSGQDELGGQGDKTPRLYWCDNGDTGTYQFMMDNHNLIVADYNDEDYIYSTHPIAGNKTFDALYDVGVTQKDIIYILSTLIFNNAYAFMSIESKVLDHTELMKRPGWNDRLIKKHFGIVPMCKIDHVQYYELVKVLEIESTLES